MGNSIIANHRKVFTTKYYNQKAWLIGFFIILSLGIMIQPQLVQALGPTVSFDAGSYDYASARPIITVQDSNANLIISSLVLDVIRGGSGVQRPSFGGGYYHYYSDGLTFTQGKNTTTFDTSQYNQELPRQVMVTGIPVNMTFKTYQSFNPEGVMGMTLYIIPRGEDFNMDASNSIASIEWKKDTPVEVDDHNHILSGANSSSTTDGKFQYTQFSFTPTKSYHKISFLVRAWNDHIGTTEVRVHAN